jgi:Ni/Co efflux regulator RcnB
MKARWWMAVCAMGAFAMFSGSAAMAQGDEHHEHHWDDRNPRFDDHEREATRNWYEHHHDHPVIGFREEDRLPRDWEPRLQVGFVFDSGWRRRVHPVPVELLGELPPPPRHYRYYVIGGHVVLVDQHWRVADVININL